MPNFYYDYFYSAVAGVAVAVHLIINWHQLVGSSRVFTHAWTRDFRRFLYSVLVFFLADFLWGVLSGLKLRGLLYADTVLFFLMMALSVCAWVRFVVAYLHMKGLPRKILLVSGHAILALMIAALVLNAFTGDFFTVGESCLYKVGALRNLALKSLIAFNALGSLFTLVKLIRLDGATRRRYTMVFAFGVTMAVAIAIQLGDPFLPTYGLGCLLGCCLMHVFVFEDERDELHKKEMLARDCQARLESERNANQAKSLFFSSVSHDIRTPLNAIVGFSELLERGVESKEESRHFIKSISTSAKTLARLVDDILDLSKLESGKLEIAEEPADVPAIIREVLEVTDIARKRKGLGLKTEIDMMPPVYLDPFRIRQILYNLLANAYKYTERGTVTVGAKWRDGTLALSIADTGVGISKDNIEKILQPFVQVVDRNNRNGTGLGLPICNKLAKLMGGRLEITSEIGVGSTFTVTIPGVKEVALPPAPADGNSGPESAAGTKDAPHPSCRVLVVDDSKINRMVLKAMLSKLGVNNVEMAENGSEALSILREDRNFGIILTDLWMPEMDGYALARGIRADKKLKYLPVYLITADVEAHNNEEAELFDGILLKPVSLDKLKPLFDIRQ